MSATASASTVTVVEEQEDDIVQPITKLEVSIISFNTSVKIFSNLQFTGKWHYRW